jgi:hypothetical protein
MILNNALAWRGLKPKLTASSIVARSILFLFVSFLVMLLVFSDLIARKRPPATTEINEALFALGMVYLGIEIVLVIFLSLATLIDSLISERAKQTIDFVETLPLSPREKIVGLLVGNNGLLLVAGLLFGLLGTIAIAMSGPTAFFPFLLVQLAMIGGWLTFGLFGITVSAMAGRFQLGMILAGVWLILSATMVRGFVDSTATPVFCAINPWLWLVGLMEYAPGKGGTSFSAWTQYAMFYGERVFWLVPLFSLYALGSFFFYGTAKQALSRPTAPAGSRWGALAYATVGHLLLVGFLYLWLGSINPHSLGILDGEISYVSFSGRYQYEAIVVYVALAFFAAGIWSMRTTPSYQSTLDWLRRKKGAIAILKQDSSSPAWLGTFLMGCLAALAGAAAMSLYHGGVAGWYWIVAGVLLAYLLAYHCLYYVGSLINPRAGAAGGIGLVVAWLVVIGVASVIENSLSLQPSPHTVAEYFVPVSTIDELIPNAFCDCLPELRELGECDSYSCMSVNRLCISPRAWWGIVAAAAQLLLFASILYLRLRSLKRVRPELTPALRPKQKT